MQSKCCKRETAARRCKRLLMRKKNQKRRLWILLRMNIKAIANAKKDEAAWPRQLNGEYKEGELIAYLPYSIFVTETTSPATPARARTAQTAVQTAASWFAASRSMR